MTNRDNSASEYDVFISYAQVDNGDGWIFAFVDELLAEHRKFSGGRELTCFFDKHDIGSLDDWQHSLSDGLARSRPAGALHERLVAEGFCLWSNKGRLNPGGDWYAEKFWCLYAVISQFLQETAMSWCCPQCVA